MPIYPALTAGSLMRELAQMLDDLIFDGTATTGAAASLTDAAIQANANDDELIIGAWLYTTGGASSGDERKCISPYTASTGLTTVDRAFTATPTSTTTYILTREHRPTLLLRALQGAQRYQAQRMLTGLPVVGREIVLGSVVPNNFDLFTTANVPDDTTTITTQGTVTSEITVTHGTRRSLRVVSNGTNAAFVRFAAPRWGKWRGKTAQLRVLIRASIASRVTAEINDGTGTATTDTVAANDTWDWLSLDRAINSAATQVRFSVEVSAGAAVTVDISYWYAPEPIGGHHEYAIDVDRLMFAIGQLKISGPVGSESGNNGYHFPIDVPRDAYEIFEDTEPVAGGAPVTAAIARLLRLNLGSEWNGRVLEYTGIQRHADLTGPTVSYGGTPELILARAKYIITQDPDDLQAALVAEKELALNLRGYTRIFSQ